MERRAAESMAAEPLATLTGKGWVSALRDAGITFFTGVPDSDLRDLIFDLEHAELNRGYLLATREENAIALAVGAWLAGDRPLVFMESAGLAAAIDAVSSLAVTYRVPLVLLVAWAGYGGRDVMHKNAFGRPLREVLGLLGVPSLEMRADAGPQEAGRHVRQALDLGVEQACPVALLAVPPELAAPAATEEGGP